MTEKKSDQTSAPKKRPIQPCPICNKASIQAYFPFCSKRCADVDLGRWFSEGYTVLDKS